MTVRAMTATRRTILCSASAGLLAVTTPLAIAASAPTLTPPLLGDVNAPKRLVMWGSLTCPFTAMLAVVLKRIVTDMKSVASLEWRHFPTHPPDPALHVAGLAFQGEHFWGFAMNVLRAVYNANGDHTALTPTMLAEFARAEGGTQKTLDAAYADKTKWAAVKADLLAGRLLGVTRTPALFYNGYFMTPDGVPLNLNAFDKSLREMLAKA